ncbi:hypothetical protein VOLCADRAFT_104078 [Volvox carteri f. nagariensis]|uniref:Uncharacterized protein n=1 Tax=Volvox carteri f. nagariensis TaxID=3068 RepID=D8TR27_VOLCA|nr:uncharacterized protein VOLCADRAFT_104078 [Volvox carteri f. nagariensis]EFJ50128.1 hypothetical protein VOLCADRAFT_104078 [Volvox carteri f. nagariensis]|eukprot:XP_002948748.1 hypothetical protein VOLCADRAFT_104078 [Volvox carteri f. nagariensis]
MQATKQFSPGDKQKECLESTTKLGRVDCVSVCECPPLRLSESSANLLSPTCSQLELADYRAGICSPEIGCQENELELVGFQVVGQGMRPTSSASLTCNSYVSPSSGDSTPTSFAADTEADSATDYSATAAHTADYSASSVLTLKPSACVVNKDALPGLSCGGGSDSDGTHGGNSPAVEGMASGEVSYASDEDDGSPYLPREIHPFDVQLARMLSAVSQAAGASPAQLLQPLLNFAAEDYQDLVNALVESGCGCVHLLACHLHNLRTMAEEAIDNSSPAAITAAAATARADAAAANTSTATATATSAKAAQAGKGASERGIGGRKGRASTQAASASSPDAGPEDKAAQESLRASIMDQYRRVVYRLVDTALGLLNKDAGHLPPTVQPPPPPPPPPPSIGRGCGGAGATSSGRAQAEQQLGRSRSVPVSGSAAAVAGIPTQAVGAVASASLLRSGQGQKVMMPGAPTCINSVLSSNSTMISRAAGETAGIGAAPRNTGVPASVFAALANAADAAPPRNGFVDAVDVMQAMRMQQLAPSTAPDVVEALSIQHLSGGAAGPLTTAAAAAAAAAAGPLFTGPTSSLAARGRSLSQSSALTGSGVMPAASATAAARGRAATAESYTGVGAGLGPQLGLGLPRGLQVLSPSDLAPPSALTASSSANMLNAAAAATAAQLMQAYDNAATLAEQGVWRPEDSLAALQWQLPTAAAVAAPFGGPVGGLVGPLSSAGCEHPQPDHQQQQLMMMMQSGLLPAAGAGTVGGNVAAVAAAAAAAAAALPYGTATSFPGVQLPGGWIV